TKLPPRMQDAANSAMLQPSARLPMLAARVRLALAADMGEVIHSRRMTPPLITSFLASILLFLYLPWIGKKIRNMVINPLFARWAWDDWFLVGVAIYIWLLPPSIIVCLVFRWWFGALDVSMALLIMLRLFAFRE